MRVVKWCAIKAARAVWNFGHGKNKRLIAAGRHSSHPIRVTLIKFDHHLDDVCEILLRKRLSRRNNQRFKRRDNLGSSHLDLLPGLRTVTSHAGKVAPGPPGLL